MRGMPKACMQRLNLSIIGADPMFYYILATASRQLPLLDLCRSYPYSLEDFLPRIAFAGRVIPKYRYDDIFAVNYCQKKN